MSRSKENSKIYKTREEFFQAEHQRAMEAFKKIDMSQVEALLAQRRQKK